MIDQVGKADFAGCVTERFLVQSGLPDGFELVLIQVTEQQGAPRQEVFSLLFRGPAERPLGQGICPLEHERLGRLAIFLVPVGRDEAGLLYEAVFNRLLPA